MSDDAGKVVVTLKGGAGYEAPWLVLRSDTPADMIELLKAVREANLDVAVRAAAQTFTMVATGSPQAAAEAMLGATPVPGTPPVPAPAQALSGTQNGPQIGQPIYPAPNATPGNGIGNYPGGNQPPQQLPQALQPACPTCGGPTVFKTDSKSNPPQWKGWFCQNAPRGTKHDVTWVK